MVIRFCSFCIDCIHCQNPPAIYHFHVWRRLNRKWFVRRMPSALTLGSAEAHHLSIGKILRFTHLNTYKNSIRIQFSLSVIYRCLTLQVRSISNHSLEFLPWAFSLTRRADFSSHDNNILQCYICSPTSLYCCSRNLILKY